MSTARRSIVPYLAAMTHHCKNRELTVAMAAAYDLEAEHVAFVTGSGKDTNKVQGIVEDAERLREEAAVEHSGGAFEGAKKTAFGGGEWGDGEDEGEATADGDVVAADGDGQASEGEDPADADDDQASFSDFT